MKLERWRRKILSRGLPLQISRRSRLERGIE